MKTKFINLALQGGGSHGAFTWGVLDRLLEEKHIEIEGISGTSAGAVNGALLATGLVLGGREKAKEHLHNFWTSVGLTPSVFPTFLSTLSEKDVFSSYVQSFNGVFIGYLSQVFSPYELNPLNANPMKELLEKTVDFECLRQSNHIKIYVSATDVESNRIKVFDNEDICVEALLASTCIPTVHQAVQWKDHYFWDGGFMGNPILEPLIFNCESKDLIIVQVNPIHKKGVPKTTRDIFDRLNQIIFNSSIIREIRGILNIQKLSQGRWDNHVNPYANLKIHAINDEIFMGELGASSKFNVHQAFLHRLYEQGREAASKWFRQKGKKIGEETSIDLSKWRIETHTTKCLKWAEHECEKKHNDEESHDVEG